MQHNNKPILTHITAICIVSFSSAFSPVIAFDNIDPADTTYYYNERGKLLWRDGNTATTINYVIKTKKRPDEVFQELVTSGDDAAVQVSADYASAAILFIPRRTARKVERLIRKGQINNPLVTENIIPVLDKKIMRRMYDNIQSYCKNNSNDGFRERGGVLLPDGTLTCITGDVTDPRTFAGASLYLKQKGLVYYHSHPYGSIEKVNGASFASMEQPNPNRVYLSQTKQTQWVTYIQGPSKQDQDAVGLGTGYVFGMREGTDMIYIYDREGIKATLPMSFVRKMEKPAGRETRKVETYMASIAPVLQLSRLF